MKETEKNTSEEKIHEENSKEIKKKIFSKKEDKNKIKIKELENKLEETKADFLRARADYENYRRRMEKESLEIRDRAIASFVMDLLPSIDNFEMSLKMTDNKEMFIKGVEMIHKNLLDTLKEHKFEEYLPQLGESFNPILHDPVLIENKEKKVGEIVAIIKKGFKHKEKVIRPARVEVVKEIEEEPKVDEN
ncbi:MAG: nucleotide exchange factor GrpE [Nanoarchaeota archaeon]|nr:nucleotide exchange factor GrpE [Nanoarchaeota archaeon]